MSKKKIAKYLFIIFFGLFIIFYIIEKSGYYEYNLQKKTYMTNESMDKFEKDIKDGKDVLMEDYVVSTEKDYTTRLTHETNKITTSVNKVLKNTIEDFFKILGSFVED